MQIMERMPQPPVRKKKLATTIATKDDWIARALHALVTEGVDAVLVLPLAKTLGVSRSSFYWYFKNRDDILDHLLKHWVNTNTQAIIEHAARPSRTIIAGVLNIFECWVSEETYSPKLDIAVRNWARQSKAVRRLVEKADSDRVEAIKLMYARHGFPAKDAFIRARVLYYMQVGYYVLDLREPMETRLSNIVAYLRAFTNQEPSREDVRQFVRFAEDINARRKLKGRSAS